MAGKKPGRKPKTPLPIDTDPPPTCLDLPPGGARGDLLWHDGERLAWLPAPTGEGQILTSGANGTLVWANPPGLAAPKPNGDKPPEKPPDDLQAVM